MHVLAHCINKPINAHVPRLIYLHMPAVCVGRKQAKLQKAVARGRSAVLGSSWPVAFHCLQLACNLVIIECAVAVQAKWCWGLAVVSQQW
jgi:primosomal replication protein N